MNEANPIGTASQHSSRPCAKLVSAEDELGSSFEATPNGRIVGRYSGRNVLVGVHLLVFESARFTLEALLQ